MPVNDEVRKAVEECAAQGCESAAETIRAELTRLYAIADSVDPLVVRLGEVAEKLARANALLRECLQYHGVMLMSDPPQDAWKYHRMNERINAHLSEPRT